MQTYVPSVGPGGADPIALFAVALYAPLEVQHKCAAVSSQTQASAG